MWYQDSLSADHGNWVGEFVTVCRSFFRSLKPCHRQSKWQSSWTHWELSTRWLTTAQSVPPTSRRNTPMALSLIVMVRAVRWIESSGLPIAWPHSANENITNNICCPKPEGWLTCLDHKLKASNRARAWWISDKTEVGHFDVSIWNLSSSHWSCADWPIPGVRCQK